MGNPLIQTTMEIQGFTQVVYMYIVPLLEHLVICNNSALSNVLLGKRLGD